MCYVRCDLARKLYTQTNRVALIYVLYGCFIKLLNATYYLLLLLLFKNILAYSRLTVFSKIEKYPCVFPSHRFFKNSVSVYRIRYTYPYLGNIDAGY
jgi:hypothetical protein